jgi:PAS domain S-box-containing protein
VIQPCADHSHCYVESAVRTITDANGVLIGYITINRDVTERYELLERERQAFAETAAMLALLNTLLETAPIGIGVFDRELRYQHINDALAAINGLPAHAHIGRTITDILPKTGEWIAAYLSRVRDTGEPIIDMEFQFPAIINGRNTQYWSMTCYPIRQHETIIGVAAILVDVTNRRQLEEELLQAQKLESVGRLTGGIAHDFNNILTAIAGYTSLVQADLEQHAITNDDVREVLLAVERATALNRQLLSFVRRQTITPRLIDLNTLVLQLKSLLRRLIGEHIDLVIQTSDTSVMIEADPNQIEQILLNLALNARDAMPNGGQITITIGKIRETHAFLTVTDTGIGMDYETSTRAFEPFFTTKANDQGSGLGLSTCATIVRQYGGRIELDSAPGRGTRVMVRLPAVQGVLQPSLPSANTQPMPRGHETILVVEDDESVRRVTLRLLRAQGYHVLEAATPAEALELAKIYTGRHGIDLLVADLVLPEMLGYRLTDRLIALFPNLRVLIMSGYPDEILAPPTTKQTPGFISKPFQLFELANKVREILDQPLSREV